jgi:membrane protein DedA with SNARE-associated domain
MASWVINSVYVSGYMGIIALMFIENVFPPIPSELIMPLAGYVTTQGKLSLAGVIVAGTAGSVLGALPLYYLGRFIDPERLKSFADRHGRWLALSRDDLSKAEHWFKRYGGTAVFLCRLVPGVRSLISIPAGIYRMELIRFLVYTSAGAAIWTALLAYGGFLLGNSFTKVGEYLDPISWGVLAIIATWYVVRVVRGNGGPRKQRR